MTITHDRSAAGATLLAVAGPMTIYEAADHKRELLQAVAAGAVVRLDLSRVDEFDTAGVQLLVLAQREAQRAGGLLQVAAASEPVADAVQRWGLGALLATGAA